MTTKAGRYGLPARLLHWTMAVMVIAMLLIGIGMVGTTTPRYLTLVSIHKPLGMATLGLVVLRLINRLANRSPALSLSVPKWQRRIASASHMLLYGLMIAVPITGWAMLSAEDYPIILFGGTVLPRLVSQDAALFVQLRSAHGMLAAVLFGTFILHLAAVLFHQWVRRDAILDRMI